MADAQLSTSITSISERASEVAVSASADDLQKISRVAPSLEQSENAALEVAINTRAAAIAGTATAADLKKIGKAIGNMLEPQTDSISGEFIGAQSGHSGKFFSTNGTAKNWGGVTVGGLQQVQLSTIENDQTLVYNSVSGKFENSSRAFDIPQYSLTQNLPASGTTGEVVFDVQSSQLKYWNGSEWKVAAVVAGGGAVSGKIVIGARYDDDNGNNSGSVYVYDLDGTNEVKITASDGVANDRFGERVAIDGNNIVVSSYQHDGVNGGLSGAAYVYDLDGTNEVKITASDGAVDDKFGWSVAIGNNKVVVGSHEDDDNGTQSGSVYVYDLDGTNEVKITASDGAYADKFGESVAIGNNKIVVGAFQNDDNGDNSGSVYVYDLDGTNEVKITASDAAENDRFGVSVAVGSNKIVVGAFRDDDNGAQSGSVYVYDLDGSNEVKITASDGSATGLFGWSVAVSDNKIAVGSYGDAANGSYSGSAYVYDLDGTNEVKITASDAAAENYFGYTVAVSDSKIIVGALLGDDDNGESSGAAYVYDLDGSNEVKITASDAYAGDYFGIGVAISGGSSASSSSGESSESTSTIKSVQFLQPYSGGGRWIVVADSDDFTLTGAFTIETWLKPAGTVQAASKTYTTIASKWTPADPEYWFGFVANGGQQNIRFSWADQTSAGDSNSPILNYPTNDFVDGSWVHVAVVRTTDGTITMYVNGVSVDSVSRSFTPAPGSTSEPLYIGSYNAGEGNADWEGLISDFRIVNGDAVYTANFTPPTQPLQKIANTVLLTARGLESATVIADESDSNHTIETNYAVEISDEMPYTISSGSSSSAPVDWSPLTLIQTAGKSVYDITSGTTGESDLAVDMTETHTVLGVDKAYSGYGSAYIIDTVSGNVTATINNPNPLTAGSFGRRNSVGTDGTHVVLGNRDQDEVYVYNMSGTLLRTISGPDSGAMFGHSVKIDGDYIAVGGYNQDKAYICSTSTGAILHTLTNPNVYGSTPDQFGQVVDISGNFMVVSTVEEDAADGSNSGVAYVYTVDAGSLLHTFVNPNAHGTSALDNFGIDCALDGNYLVVGAFGESDAAVGSGSGKAYFYNVATGTLLHTIDNPNPDSGTEVDYMGWSVDVEGQTAIVSAWYETGAAGADSGKCYLYDVVSGNLLHTIEDPNVYSGGGTDDRFGSEVAIAGTFISVSAKGEDHSDQDNVGALYVFKGE